MFTAPTFVREVPAIEITDGLVHITTTQGEWYWLPSTFRAYVEDGRRKLADFDRESRGAVPFKVAG